MFEKLEPRNMLTVPFGALPDDTGEFMLGDIVVTPVFFESNGQNDPDTEDWTPTLIEHVKQKVVNGGNWWENTLTKLEQTESLRDHHLDFKFDFTYADTPVSTGYEPISRRSDDFDLWMGDFLRQAGITPTGPNGFSEDIRKFNHAQRIKHNADWAFTIFVAADFNDSDQAFRAGGSFSRAFSFAGGRFFVTPASRPGSTFAHEIAHAFWARDEYPGGGAFSDRRGYYNSENTNAANNPAPGFEQQVSLLAANPLLTEAFNTNTSSRSSLDMIGWRDSDNNGVFDVLDVPFTLDGTGFHDAVAGQYRFVGSSSVQTLPNHNSSGLQNDITINEISRAVYRIDGRAWQTAATYNTYTADLDLAISVPPGFQTIEIRTIDDSPLGISSPTFLGHANLHESVVQPGLSGFVWNDVNRNGVFDATESGISDWEVQLVDGGGNPVNLQETFEPDDFAAGTTLNDVHSDVRVRVEGSALGDTVKAGPGSPASTDSLVFQHDNSSSFSKTRRLRFDFTSPVTSVSVDAVSNLNVAYGRLEIYDSQDNLLSRYTTSALPNGNSETMTLARDRAEIAYALAYGHTTSVQLDNLRFGPDTTVRTDSLGAWSIPNLPAGTYTVASVVQPSFAPVTAASQTVSTGTGEVVSQVNFGNATQAPSPSPWQNAVNRFDVNEDNKISPLDVLLVIRDLNQNGPRELQDPVGGGLPPAFLDVSGDRFVTSQDALQLIDRLNRESPPAVIVASSHSVDSPSHGEGEASVDALLPPAQFISPMAAVAPPVQDAHDVGDETEQLRGETAGQAETSAGHQPADLTRHAESSVRAFYLLDDDLLSDLAVDHAVSPNVDDELFGDLK